MKLDVVCFLLVLAYVSFPQRSCNGQPVSTFTYQGYLSSGAAAADGVFDIRVGIYPTNLGGAALSPNITNAAVPVNRGIFTLHLDFGNNAFTGENRWLEIAVKGAEDTNFVTLSPRQLVTATPHALYAVKAGTASAVSSNSISSINLQNNSVDSGKIADGSIGANDLNSNLLNATFWKLNGNSGTQPVANFIGTIDIQPLEFRVNGARALRIEPPINYLDPETGPNLIGGSPSNAVSKGVVGATISGGAKNSISSDHGTIGGGKLNSILDSAHTGTISGGFANGIESGAHVAAIGGGAWNLIASNASASTITGGEDNLISTDASSSTIGGGGGNTILSHSEEGVIGGGGGNIIEIFSSASTIAGGHSNGVRNRADAATISGGRFNTISDDASASVVAGGANNIIYNWAQSASIGGGSQNFIQTNAGYSSIGGGTHNVIGPNSGACRIGGGLGNEIGGGSLGATIGGGYYNLIGTNGDGATIPGGWNNYAANSSFALGVGARATNRGAFVWNDSAGPYSNSTNDNSVTMRACGGFRFLTATNFSGVYLAPGSGAWAALSDQNSKENIKPVQPDEILRKVAALAVSTWNYKSQTNTIRHIGPMAQEFSRSFEVGDDERHITSLDESGVALAAIQALNNRLESELILKDSRIRDLEHRLERLEKMIIQEKSTP